MPDFFSFSLDMNVLVWEFSGLWTLGCPGGVSGFSGVVSWGSLGYSMLFGLPLPGLHKSYFLVQSFAITSFTLLVLVKLKRFQDQSN